MPHLAPFKWLVSPFIILIIIYMSLMTTSVPSRFPPIECSSLHCPDWSW